MSQILWRACTIFVLTTNMRLQDPNISGSKLIQMQEFNQWLLDMGAGRLPTVSVEGDDDGTWITIPDDLLVPIVDDPIQAVTSMIYADIVGAPIILLRNLNLQMGLCNGTRLVVTQIGRRVIEAVIITGTHVGDTVIIGRVDMTPTDSCWPFTLQRRQFPVKVCFAMTINKSQGQTFNNVCVYLDNPSKKMSSMYRFLSDLKPELTDTWKVHVMVSRKWRTFNPRSGKILSADLILTDERNRSIHARIPESLMECFYNKLTEGVVYQIHQFEVKVYQTQYRPLNRDMFIQLLRRTSIRASHIPATAFQRYCFDFIAYGALQSHVIGYLREWSFVKQTGDTSRSNVRQIILSDDSHTEINVSLWGNLATKFTGEHIRSLNDKKILVVLSSCKVTTILDLYLKLQEGVEEGTRFSICGTIVDVDVKEWKYVRCSDCRKKAVLCEDVIGYLREWSFVKQIGDTSRSNVWQIILSDESHTEINVSLWGNLATKFTNEHIRSLNDKKILVVLSSCKVTTILDLYLKLQEGVEEGTRFSICGTIVDVDVKEWKYVRCSDCRKKAVLCEDVIGYLREWSFVKQIGDTSRSNVWQIILSDESHTEINVSLWGNLATKFTNEHIRSLNDKKILVVLSSCKVGLSRGVPALHTTCASDIYLNIPLNEMPILNTIVTERVTTILDLYLKLQEGVEEGTRFCICGTIVDVDVKEWKYVRCSDCRKKAVLCEGCFYCGSNVIGYLREWSFLKQIGDTSRSNVRQIILSDESHTEINVSLWGNLATKFTDEHIRSLNDKKILVVLSSCKVGLSRGVPALHTTCASDIYLNIPLNEMPILNTIVTERVTTILDLYLKLQEGVEEVL
ncbi:hypothetical protein LXL04_028559 [Taraxacum kok-saghyz]